MALLFCALELASLSEQFSFDTDKKDINEKSSLAGLQNIKRL